MNEKTVWGIHAGKMGDADSLFLKKNCIAIGWVDMGNLANIDGTREAFKEKVGETYPGWKPGRIPNNAGQLFRFVHEIELGDYVVYPSKQDRHIHIGEITGDYSYQPEISESYPQIRSVKWLKHIPRTSFSQGALYESGSALTLFQIKSYSDEYLSKLTETKSQSKVESESDDDTVALVASDIEEQTRDFVIKQLSKNLKGLPFEEFVVHLLENMGYHARLARVNEPSVDIIAHKDELGVEPPIIKVQVKSSDGNIGDRDVSALYGKVDTGEFGLLVTLGQYSSAAVTFANSKTNLRLIDGDELVLMVLQHYERFDSKYRGIIPLKRVYIPQALEED